MNRSIQFCLCAVVIICLRPALAALPFALPFALGTALVDGGTGSGQSSTLLPDGRLLVIGGQGPSGPLATAGIKDAQTASITQVSGQLQYARAWHTATLLPDGTILVLGGVGRSNVIVSQAEVFDPAARSFKVLASTGLTPRADHTATLLTDGRVLITGGVGASGEPLGQLELWDFRTGQAMALAVELHGPRARHTATLLPDGTVLILGGVDANGAPVTYGEIFDPSTQSIRIEGSAVYPTDDPKAPVLEQSLPDNGATDVPVDALIASRFSKPLKLETVNTSTVTLSGSEGTVAAKVIPAEGGMLAFVLPQAALQSGSIYTLSLARPTDSVGQAFPDTSIVFTTAGSATGTTGSDGSDSGLNSSWRKLPPLTAPPGVTALAGQVLKLNGTPLPHVLVEIDAKDSTHAYSDNTGRILASQARGGPSCDVHRRGPGQRRRPSVWPLPGGS